MFAGICYHRITSSGFKLNFVLSLPCPGSGMTKKAKMSGLIKAE